MPDELSRSKEYYDTVFLNVAKIMRVIHRNLNFGYITVYLHRNRVVFRWTVIRKGHKKFIKDTTIDFEKLYDTNRIDVSKLAQGITDNLLALLPKDLILNPSKPNE